MQLIGLVLAVATTLSAPAVPAPHPEAPSAAQSYGSPFSHSVQNLGVWVGMGAQGANVTARIDGHDRARALESIKSVMIWRLQEANADPRTAYEAMWVARTYMSELEGDLPKDIVFEAMDAVVAAIHTHFGQSNSAQP